MINQSSKIVSIEQISATGAGRLGGIFSLVIYLFAALLEGAFDLRISSLSIPEFTVVNVFLGIVGAIVSGYAVVAIPILIFNAAARKLGGIQIRIAE